VASTVTADSAVAKVQPLEELEDGLLEELVLELLELVWPGMGPLPQAATIKPVVAAATPSATAWRRIRK
jgi:hypothetical protein